MTTAAAQDVVRRADGIRQRPFRGRCALAGCIYSFGRDDVEWDGHWLLLLVSVPEAQRDLRHRIRSQLNWAGFGPRQPACGSARTRASRPKASAFSRRPG